MKEKSAGPVGKKIAVGAAPPSPAKKEASTADAEVGRRARAEGEAALEESGSGAPASGPLGQAKGERRDAGGWLEQQRASGLFGADAGEAALQATVAALRACLAEGFTTSHAIYGAQVKRALYAAVALLDAAPSQDTQALAALLLLLAEGRVTAKEMRAAVQRAKGSGDVVKSIDDVAALRTLASLRRERSGFVHGIHAPMLRGCRLVFAPSRSASRARSSPLPRAWRGRTTSSCRPPRRC